MGLIIDQLTHLQHDIQRNAHRDVDLVLLSRLIGIDLFIRRGRALGRRPGLRVSGGFHTGCVHPRSSGMGTEVIEGLVVAQPARPKYHQTSHQVASTSFLPASAVDRQAIMAWAPERYSLPPPRHRSWAGILGPPQALLGRPDCPDCPMPVTWPPAPLTGYLLGQHLLPPRDRR